MLDPQYFVSRHKNTRFSNCFLRPNWLYPHPEDSSGLAIPPSNVTQLVQMTHAFTGTATKCEGSRSECDIDHVTIYGFAICDECRHGKECAHPPWDKIVETCLRKGRARTRARRV